MKIRLRTLILAWLIIFLLLLWAVKAWAITPNLSGGIVSTRDMSIWELYRYKYTDLLRKFPYCPFKAYLVISQKVKVEVINNEHCLIIPDLLAELQEDTNFNRAFAKAFKARGSPKRKVKKIYDYCAETKYVPHIKTAREVFTTRQGDCAGISAAFYVLCKAKHIPVRYVIGWGEGTCHGWNRVKINGRWWWVDCTLHRYLRKRLWSGYTVMEMW